MADMYTKENCLSLVGEDLMGKILVLRPGKLAPEFREGKWQLWRADGGFGCNPTSFGRAIFATCLADGEKARWNREDFLGVANGISI